MTNKYERLDAFLEKAFEGSPNSPEACETKIEITTNLRQEYDDLLVSGIDEDEALTRTCDSLGDITELFGTAKSVPDAPNDQPIENGQNYQDYQNYQNYQNQQNQQNQQNGKNQKRSTRKKPPVSPFRQLAVTLGVLLCALCWVPTVLLSVNGHEDSYIAAPVLISVALGVLLFIYSGAMRVGVSVSHRLHFFMIGLGVACEIACAAPLLIVGEDTTLGLSLLFILIALGVVLIVGGAMIPCDKYGGGDNDDNDECDDDDDREANDTPPIYRPIKRLIVTLMLISYFVVSFATGAWAVTWLIFLIGGAVDDLALAIIKLAAEGKSEK